MTTLSRRTPRAVLAATLLVLLWPCYALTQERLAPHEAMMLTTCDRILRLFHHSADSIWPGFDLSRRPFVAYLPDRWALLLNVDRPIDGFSAYPAAWPALSSPAQFHRGQYEDLVGQLAFDLKVDTLTTVGIGFPESLFDSVAHPSAYLFGAVVHEAFHQYQAEAFGETGWEREERYPILDPENTALATLEMRLLADALVAAAVPDSVRLRQCLEQFVAVRAHRWRHAVPFVARYEQGQELHEGTARYVEMRAIQLVRLLRDRAPFGAIAPSVQEDFAAFAFPRVLISDLQERITNGTVLPDDMLRNRIYPIGSAIGSLLDGLGVAWKPRAQQAGPDLTFAGLLAERLGMPPAGSDSLVAVAQQAYRYQDLLRSARAAITDYEDGYRKELAAFDAQPGLRVTVEFTTKKISRSRAARAKKWLVEEGSRSLCRNYEVYTLKNSDLHLELKSTGVLEQTAWENKHYVVTFVTPELPRVEVNGTPGAAQDQPQPFASALVRGPNFTLTCSKAGSIVRHGNEIAVKIQE